MARRSLLCGCALWILGCSSLQVPAIDPSGERILLPHGSYTTLQAPFDAPPQWTCLPEPAFREPPPVPPCEPVGPPLAVAPPATTPPAPPPSLPAQPLPNQQDRLILTPTRLVAPVGSEVVLVAGVCGPRGRYVTRQPIEWHLSGESVGHLVDRGQKREHLHGLFHHSARSFSNEFAQTTTLHRARVLTRGTASPNDDVWIRSGQTWITLTSAAEGVSHVSAVAPAAENWNQRRQTATVHWVDAEWRFPAPAIVAAGQEHTLVTRLTRSSDGRPLRDWIVRYQVVEGTEATFAPSGANTIESNTDAQGEARARLIPLVREPGATRIKIEILSPHVTQGSAPVVVGHGLTTITWSAPGLQVTLKGPDALTVGNTATYRVDVSNPGDLRATQVKVRAVVPGRLEVVDAPGGQLLGSDIVWQFAELAPRQAQPLEFRCRAVSAGDVRVRVEADADGGLRDAAELLTAIDQPAIRIEIVDSPDTVSVGEPFQTKVRVANVGRRTLTNVVVRDEFDAGLEHRDGLTSPIEKDLGEIAPGNSVPFAITFIARRPGTLSHRLEVTADGQHFSSEPVRVEVTQGALKLELRKTGPARRRVGEEAEYTIEVRNTGTAALTDVRLYDLPGNALEPKRLSPDFKITPSGILWELGTLAPDELVTRRVLCECVQEDPQAENVVFVTAAENVRQESRSVTAISAGEPPAVETPSGEPPASEDAPPAAGAPEPARDSGPPGDAAAAQDGGMQLTLVDLINPIAVGETTTYIVEIKNLRQVTDQRVKVRFTLPSGLEFVRLEPEQLTVTPSESDPRTFEVEPIAEMRVGETRALRIHARGRRPGDYTVQLEVESLRTPEPIRDTKVTRVRE